MKVDSLLGQGALHLATACIKKDCNFLQEIIVGLSATFSEAEISKAWTIVAPVLEEEEVVWLRSQLG